MPAFRMKLNKNRFGFTLVELLVSMVIVSFLGGAVFVTFSQGVKLWQSAVREGTQGEEAFFFESLRSELRNAFLYGKTALNGQADVLEFHTMLTRLGDGVSGVPPAQVPAWVRYRYLSSQKIIQKEILFYEKMLQHQNSAAEVKVALDQVSQMRFEFDAREKSSSASVWRSRWKDTCFPGTIKITMDARSGSAAKLIRMIGIPAQGECSETKDKSE